jgi:hypothetical protein
MNESLSMDPYSGMLRAPHAQIKHRPAHACGGQLLADLPHSG